MVVLNDVDLIVFSDSSDVLSCTSHARHLVAPTKHVPTSGGYSFSKKDKGPKPNFTWLRRHSLVWKPCLRDVGVWCRGCTLNQGSRWTSLMWCLLQLTSLITGKKAQSVKWLLQMWQVSPVNLDSRSLSSLRNMKHVLLWWCVKCLPFSPLYLCLLPLHKPRQLIRAELCQLCPPAVCWQVDKARKPRMSHWFLDVGFREAKGSNHFATFAKPQNKRQNTPNLMISQASKHLFQTKILQQKGKGWQRHWYKGSWNHLGVSLTLGKQPTPKPLPRYISAMSEEHCTFWFGLLVQSIAITEPKRMIQPKDAKTFLGFREMNCATSQQDGWQEMVAEFKMCETAHMHR